MPESTSHLPDPPPTFRRRQLLVVGGGLGLGALLGACGSGTGRGGSAGGLPRISHWYHQYGEPGVERAVERYAGAYRRAEVRVQWRPGNYDQEIATALLADSGPDVFETSGPTVDQILAGQLVDLSDAVSGVASDFNPVLLGAKTYRGTVYGIPQAMDMQLLYYRKSMLAKAGVAPPTSLDELVTAARALTDADVKGLFLGNDGGAGALGATPLYAAGLELVTPSGAVGFADPGLAATLGKLHTLYADNSLLLGAPTDWSDPSAFVQGLTAMQWTGLWALPQVSAALGADFGVLPFPPDGVGGTPSVPVGAYACAVSSRSEHVEGARDYAAWLWVNRVDYQQDFAQSYGLHIPARLSLTRSATKLRSGPVAEAVRLATDHGYAEPLLWTPKCVIALQEALSRIIQDGADPAAQLASVVHTVQGELDRVKAKS
jgi:multiple sugar transport system substrate-binding protein